MPAGFINNFSTLAYRFFCHSKKKEVERKKDVDTENLFVYFIRYTRNSYNVEWIDYTVWLFSFTWIYIIIITLSENLFIEKLILSEFLMNIHYGNIRAHSKQKKNENCYVRARVHQEKEHLSSKMLNFLFYANDIMLIYYGKMRACMLNWCLGV